MKREVNIKMARKNTQITMTNILTPYERNSIMTVHKEKKMFEELCPTNRKLASDFLLYISINNYTYGTCMAMKATMFKFLFWNLEHNGNNTFYSLNRADFRRFFEYLIETNVKYDRIRIIKSHLNSLSEFCEHILGHKQYIWTNKVIENKWYRYKNIVKEVELPENPDDKSLPSNVHTFKEEDIERLKWYLKETRDYQSYTILYFAHLGLDILNLTIEEVERDGDDICKRWLRFLERYGIPYKQAILIQSDRNAWRPATKADLLKYEELFTAFLNKKFIICNDYRL